MRPFDTGNTAWVLASAALVLFMTPGLALFYGGLVRSKSVLTIMMQCFFCIGIVSVIWALFGFSLAFGHDAGGGLIGNLGLAGMSNGHAIVPGFEHLSVPPLAFGVFQMMFAVITAALIVSGGVDRMRFAGFVVLIVLWTVLVYVPIAHWVFSPEGWLAKRGVLDFAGGTVVEINSGFSGLGLALAIGRRRNWPKEPMVPHSVPLALVGVGILWFGWFGFNAGSAGAANSVAVHAFLNTQLAACTGLLGWLLLEKSTTGYATTVGAGSGAVAGMVAITPCAGFVGTLPSLLIGAIAGVACATAVKLKFRLRYDDSLDVLGVHGIGGVIGTVLLGVFATTSVNAAGANGLASGGGFHLLGVQALATVATALYALVMTAAIAKLVDRLVGLRVAPDVELSGLDFALHAETAYSSGTTGGHH
jgi:Amt family ammonium transporter